MFLLAMKRILWSVLIWLIPLSATAECVVVKDADGKSTHICSDDKANSYEVPSHIGGDQAGSYRREQDDAYMLDFSDDTLRENLDYGAEDDPGVGEEMGSD